MTDHYAALELQRSPTPTPEDIQTAYRKLARQLHPDRNPSPDANTQFQAVQKAYETLRDPDTRRMYDEFGAEAEQLGSNFSSVMKTRLGWWLLSDWRWVVIAVGWVVMGYMNRNWLYSPLHWVVAALATPIFSPGTFVREILQATHWRHPALIGHSSIGVLALLLQAILPLSWVTGITRFTCVLFLLGKDDRDIPLVLFVASFVTDIYGKPHDNIFNRLLGSYALLTYIVGLLPVFLILTSGTRYPRRSHLMPAIKLLYQKIIHPTLAFLMAMPLPPWIQALLVIYVPVYILNIFVSFPFDWLALVLVRGMFDLAVIKPIKRLVYLILTALAWYFIAPRVGAGPLLLNALLHCYLVRQSCGLTDMLNQRGKMPSTIRSATIFLWLVLVCIDIFLRNLSPAYPKYAAVTAAFALFGVFDVVVVKPPLEEGAEGSDEQQTAPRMRGGRRRR